MIEFNGAGIVASALDSTGTLILGEQYKHGGGEFRLEYVVAYIPDGADEWINGRYFDSKRAARRYFAERVTELYA